MLANTLMITPARCRYAFFFADIDYASDALRHARYALPLYAQRL